MERKKKDIIKTTVSFPVNIIQALRSYMLQKNISPHRQSEIVVDAIIEYLKARKIQIPKGNQKIIFEIREIDIEETKDEDD